MGTRTNRTLRLAFPVGARCSSVHGVCDNGRAIPATTSWAVALHLALFLAFVRENGYADGTYKSLVDMKNAIQ